MSKAKKTKRTYTKHPHELEGVYVLKIVMYLIVGSQWVVLTNPADTRQIPIPVGLVLGTIFAMHDHFQIDRKIEIAILLIASFVGFWAQSGIFIAILN